MRPPRSLLPFVATLALFGCGSDEAPNANPSQSTTNCGPGTLREGTTCRLAGLPPDMPCAPGEIARDEGGCEPAGIPPERCADGFVAGAARSCDAVLPPEACPHGTIAVPGDLECRDVAPCGTGTWGDIPVEADTVYVDATYAGADSDGSAAKPWTTVGDGIAAAPSGAIVAVAAGSYAENLTVMYKLVRLHGRCPAMVEIAGTGAEPTAILVANGADGTELHDLAVTGAAPVAAVGIAGVENVTLDRVWVHDATDRGITIQDEGGVTSATLRRSLVEANRDVGVFVGGATLTIEESVVRATAAKPSDPYGHGVSVLRDPGTGARGVLTLGASVVEGNVEHGVLVSASDSTVRGSVVRDTLPGVQPSAEGRFGRGIALYADAASGSAATLLLEGSVLERNREVGLFASGSEATVSATVVRDTAPNGLGVTAGGIQLEPYPETELPTKLTLDASVIERNRTAGVVLLAGTASLTGTIVRGALADDAGMFGRGVNAQRAAGRPSELTVAGSVIDGNPETAVVVIGSSATIDATVIRGGADAAAPTGRVLTAQLDLVTGEPTALTLERSLLEDSAGFGVVVVASEATLDSVLLRRVHPDAGGLFGDGVAVMSYPGAVHERGRATLRSVRIEDAARAAVSSFGADVALSGSALACQAFDLDGEALGAFDFAFTDDGSNGCGCPDAVDACRALSAQLAPPEPAASLPE